MKQIFILALAIATPSIPAMAQQDTQPASAQSGEAVTVKEGALIFTTAGRLVGTVSRVNAETVSVIYDGRFVQIPLSTLVPASKGFTTSLSKVDLRKL